MVVILDTSFIVAYLNAKDTNHLRALDVFNGFKENQYGKLIISDFILDEVITHLWIRSRRKDIVETAHDFLSEDQNIVSLLMITRPLLDETWTIWKKYAEYPKKPLSFTDCSIIALYNNYQKAYVASFDKEFEGIVNILR